MNEKYWLKGSIIALSVYAIVTLALIPFGSMGSECYVLCLPYWILPSILGGGVIGLILGGSFQILTFLIPIIGFFVIGALIGWIYGKFAKKERAVQ